MLILGDDLNIVIERKKIKNMYFRINEKNEIYVTCPKFVSKFEIERTLNNNIDALERMYKKAKIRNEENEKILFLGDEFDYIYNNKIIIDEDRFIAYGPNVESINEYLEKNSLSFFQTRLDEYINTFDDLPKFRLRIRKMKSRWGVCNISSMTVTLNSLLIHKKIYLIDYVICHELSHFHHMDHSRAFWKCVGEHYPNYKEARRELK